jgi:F-type H+-transporting ATPase subunit a
MRFVGLFIPSGTPLVILPFLFLIEIVSYISRLLSLAVRLFANMMAGHALLYILASFFVMACLSTTIGWLAPTLFLPYTILVAVTTIECCIAVLQVYVFLTLYLLYARDLS